MIKIQTHLPDGFFEEEVRCEYTITKKMKEIWGIEIDLLNEFDRVCKKHSIKYFADGGTILGAVRHKGFIPWDDDMDITMKRKDYIRFCQIAKKELEGEYEIVNLHSDDGWNHMLSRIINGRSVNYDPDHLKKFHGCPYVIGLDIFPLDYVAPTKEEDELQCEMIRIAGITAGNLNSMEDATQEEKRNMTKEILDMCNIPIRDDIPYDRQLFKVSERLCMMYTEEEATHIALMPDHAGARPEDVYPKEYYDSAIYVPFEYTEIPIPVGYEKILIQKYGENYMTPIMGGGSHEYPFYRKQLQVVLEELKLT